MAATADALAAELERTGHVVVRARRDGVGLAIVGALGFTAVGGLLLAGWLSEPSWRTAFAGLLGTITIGFFGVIGVPTLVWRWAGAARAVTVTPDGIELAGGSSARWADVRSARLVSIWGQRFAVLLPRADRVDAHARRLHPIARALAHLHGALLRERAPLALPVQLELAPGELLRLVQHARRLGGHLR